MPPTNSLARAAAAVADKAMDVLVVPGYSRIGARLRRHWWPADAVPFDVLRHVVVTGASSGLGEATTLGLARLGATVHLIGRKADRLSAAADRIRTQVPTATLVQHPADLSDLDAVRDLVRALRAALPATGLHALVHSAGVLPPGRSLTPQGHELTLATHLLGPLLLTAGLLPQLRADGDSRVIFVSSGGMYTSPLVADLEYADGEYSGTTAYARTKRMQVVLADQLAAALDGPDDPAVHSMHPGWAATPGITDALPGFSKLVRPILRSADEGADTIVWLAASAQAARGTEGFWHDRKVRPTHYLPWQRDDPDRMEHLWDYCLAATGLQQVGGRGLPVVDL